MANMMQDPMVLRQIIMDHYEYPRNNGLKSGDAYRQIHMASESCIDDIHVQIKMKDDVIEEIRFEGVACTITTSSTSIMSELLKGKTIAEAEVIIQEYFKMIDGKEYNEEILEEAVAFQNVGKQANRIKCATIGWNAMKALLQEERDGNG